MIRYLTPMLLVLALAAPAVTTAQETTATEARAQALDGLHAALLRASTQIEADRLTDQIWRLWFVAPDAEAQALMDHAVERRRHGDYEAAIATLDALTSGWPDYAEGWNQRATLFFLQDRYGPSLADVATVLALEPRHFGALSGKAVILFRQGRRDAANRALLDALRVHPWLHERALLDPAYREEPL